MNNKKTGKGAAVTLENLSKLYGDNLALDNASLEIPPGSFLTLLGPSGSGKTTALNLIAGFLQPDSGSILVDGTNISGVPPHRRNIGMVFQSYALFPHMTVYRNVEFPLRMRSELSKEGRRQSVVDALKLVRLDGFEWRYPAQLSGGQQQRVSMARALVSQPHLLLMDEPLGALDKKLRDQMQLEIKRIHETLGCTILYVTHDQSEALTMSDFVVVMRDGRIDQTGPPKEVYEKPKTAFVADFLGQANLLTGRVLGVDGQQVELQLANDVLVSAPLGNSEATVGQDVSLLVRPEWVDVKEGRSTNPAAESIEGTLLDSIYLGNSVRHVVKADDCTISAFHAGPSRLTVSAGARVYATWPRSRGRIVALDDTVGMDDV